MSLWSLTCQQSVFKRCHSDEHFSEFLPTGWRQKSAGIYMEQNYALSPYVYPAVVTVKCAIPHEKCRRGAHLPFLGREPVYRWINHWSLWRVASATPDLRLPSQPHDITAPWPVPNYTAWQQRLMCKQLAQGCCLKAERPRFEPRPSESQVQRSDHYATRKPPTVQTD